MSAKVATAFLATYDDTYRNIDVMPRLHTDYKSIVIDRHDIKNIVKLLKNHFGKSREQYQGLRK